MVRSCLLPWASSIFLWTGFIARQAFGSRVQAHLLPAERGPLGPLYSSKGPRVCSDWAGFYHMTGCEPISGQGWAVSIGQAVSHAQPLVE